MPALRARLDVLVGHQLGGWQLMASGHIQDRYYVVTDGKKIRTSYTGAKRYRVRYREVPGGPQKSESFVRKVDAQEFLAATAHALKTGTYVDPAKGRVTLREWWATWQESRSDLEWSSTVRNEDRWRLHIEPALGDAPLMSIDRPMLRAFAAQLTKGGMAPSSVRKCVQVVGQALEVAVEDHVLTSNPATRLRGLPKVKTDEAQFCSPAEIALLVSCAAERDRALIETGAWSGLRLGELTGLRRRSLDLMSARITVAETITEVRGQVIHKRYGKTAAAKRSVPIPRHLVETLTEHTAGMKADALVFTAPDGEPIRRSNFHTRVWQRATIAAGLGERVPAPSAAKPKRTLYEGLRPHDLRHTAVSFWIAAGADYAQLKKWAGHESIATLIDTYGHLMPDREEPVLEALDRLAAAAATPAGEVVELTRSGGS